MAINENEGAGTVTITNGDVKIIKEIQREFGVKSAADALAFMLYVAKEANGQPLGYKKEDGGWVGFRPSADARSAQTPEVQETSQS